MSQGVVHYKFKSTAKWDSILFDGHLMSIRDLKRAIVEQKKLNKHTGDFDLLITDAQTSEDYRNDDYLIPRNTTVSVRRVPVLAAAAIAVTVPIPTPLPESPSGRRDMIIDTMETDIGLSESLPPTRSSDFGALYRNDDAKMVETVSRTAIELVGQVPKRSPRARQSGAGRFRADFLAPSDRDICYRCGVRGHYIRDCPVNVDACNNRSRTVNPTYLRQGVHVVETKGAGGPGPAVWNVRPVTSSSSSSSSSSAHRGVDVAIQPPRELVCKQCSRLFTNAVVVECCYQTYCDECARQHLSAESRCPGCGEAQTIDDLKPNLKRQEQVDGWIRQHGRSGERR